MSYQALYRRYRPKRFEDVVGQAGDDQSVVAAGIPVAFDGVDQQPQRGRDVLLLRVPGAADVMGRPERGRTDPFEVGHLLLQRSGTRPGMIPGGHAPPRTGRCRA